jgi:hypothetical protein
MIQRNKFNFNFNLKGGENYLAKAIEPEIHCKSLFLKNKTFPKEIKALL